MRTVLSESFWLDFLLLHNIWKAYVVHSFKILFLWRQPFHKFASSTKCLGSFTPSVCVCFKASIITSCIASYEVQMGTEPILAMLLAMQLALNISKHQRKTSQTLGVNGPFLSRIYIFENSTAHELHKLKTLVSCVYFFPSKTPMNNPSKHFLSTIYIYPFIINNNWLNFKTLRLNFAV